jgi:hypothetical protein
MQLKAIWSQVLVAHACNSSYSGGRDQEDRGSKPALGKFVRCYLEKPITKTGLVEWLKVKALSSSPSTVKKKKKPFVFPVKLFPKNGATSWAHFPYL